jgi:septum formation protein
LLTPPLILASISPRRKHLLTQIGLQFEVCSSLASEDIDFPVEPQEHVCILAERKAREVARRFPNGVVIGADTIVVLDGDVITKPESEEEAVRILHRLSGRMHEVYTGFSLVEVPGFRTLTQFERTEVWFRRLGPQEILDYVDGGSPMDKAGAYGIQDDYGAVFVERINGDFYNVMGLPLSRFYTAYRTFVKDRID